MEASPAINKQAMCSCLYVCARVGVCVRGFTLK